jgi:hypothetical protein
VEEKISLMLPSQFALLFDGWTANDTHYLGVFCTFPISGSDKLKYKKVLLSFSPMGEEDSLDAMQHIQHLEYLLRFYGKWWENVSALIGDNCATNIRIASLAKCYFVGCSSHRFNLAVQDFLKSYADLLDNLNSLMAKLKNLIPAGKLRKHTLLKAKTRNLTRWSSTHDMVKRYFSIREFLPLLKLDYIDSLLPSIRQERELEVLLSVMENLESVTKALQKEDLNIGSVRSLFDAVIEEHPDMKARLSNSADIVVDATFESAISKIDLGSTESLTRAEKESVKHLIICNSSFEESNSVQKLLSFAERALKKQKKVEKSHFIDVCFIRPTSNLCERLFSKAGYALVDRRMGVSPSNFEAQIFLHVNSDLWNIEDVQELFK